MDVKSVILPDGYASGGLLCKDKSLAQQSSAADCDINKIMRRFEQNGFVTHVNDRVARYGDFSVIPDYRAALDLVRSANDLFMELPADLRERFDNDPAKMLDFVKDPKNAKEAVSLGILAPIDEKAGEVQDTGAKPVKPAVKAPEGAPSAPSAQ